MLKSTHFGACSDAMQQVHGAGVKSNINCHFFGTRFTSIRKQKGIKKPHNCRNSHKVFLFDNSIEIYQKYLAAFILSLLNHHIGISHQALVNFTCTLASLPDCFYHKRLSCMHISRNKNMLCACFVRSRQCLYIGSSI